MREFAFDTEAKIGLSPNEIDVLELTAATANLNSEQIHSALCEVAEQLSGAYHDACIGVSTARVGVAALRAFQGLADDAQQLYLRRVQSADALKSHRVDLGRLIREQAEALGEQAERRSRTNGVHTGNGRGEKRARGAGDEFYQVAHDATAGMSANEARRWANQLFRINSSEQDEIPESVTSIEEIRSIVAASFRSSGVDMMEGAICEASQGPLRGQDPIEPDIYTRLVHNSFGSMDEAQAKTALARLVEIRKAANPHDAVRVTALLKRRDAKAAIASLYREVGCDLLFEDLAKMRKASEATPREGRKARRARAV